MAEHATMMLTVFTPADTVFKGRVRKLNAIGRDGAFGILPRHVDYVAPLMPGILTIVDGRGQDSFIAIDGGVLLKIEDGVRVATRRAVSGNELASLGETVQREFLSLSEREREARSAIARLEAGIVRQFVEIGDQR